MMKQKDICIVANSFCYVYINTPVETQVIRIIQKTTWLQNVHKENPLENLFYWLPSGTGGLFQGTLQWQIFIIILIVIYLLIFFFKHFYFYTIFKGHVPFTVVTKCCLYSPYSTIHPCSLS